MVSFMEVSDDRFQAETGWNRLYSRKLLMMGTEDARSMQSFITGKNRDN
jgi:hypothetical protein